MNKRLQKIMDYIPDCEVLADIGTDHGYIPVGAVLTAKVGKAIATDISRGSLDKAAAEIYRHQLDKKIDTRLGSGLSVLEVDEADVVVIAGMGGNLMAEILETDYDITFQKKTPLLLLQPIQFPDKLRAYLLSRGFTVEDEDLVKDEGIIYQLILARKTGLVQEKLPETAVLELGAINLVKKDPLLIELIQRQIRACQKILRDLPQKEYLEDTETKKEKLAESQQEEKTEKKIQETIERINRRKQEIIDKIKRYEELMEDGVKGTGQ